MTKIKQSKSSGTLVISLDFELYWGVRDRYTKTSYENNILGVQTVVPQLLDLFQHHHIHATWAIVGFLFFRSNRELLMNIPNKIPNYVNKFLSPYDYIQTLDDREDDPFHFAPELINLISNYPFQEIATHTFSHYYCLEPGQTISEFEEDLEAAISLAKLHGFDTKSIVFPRNQINPAYLSICKRQGITAYRGNETWWIYHSSGNDHKKLIKRGLRLLDAYINISGHNSYTIKHLQHEAMLNLPSSRFLRGYSKRLKWLEPLRLKRILSDLTYAAQQGEVYHLWWHPHNFGDHVEKNLSFLEKIFEHFASLQKQYGMKSMNMNELSHNFIVQED